MSSSLTELEKLRNRLGGAARRGDAQAQQEIRHAMAVGCAERDLHAHLDGQVLTKREADRLVEVVLSFRDRDEQEREAMDRAQEVQRLAALLTAGCSLPEAVRESVAV